MVGHAFGEASVAARRGGSRPDLSAVVVTHNGRERALETLASAYQAVGDIECEWLVVDCGSCDGTPEAVEAGFPGIRVLRRHNVGFAAGNNVALREARGRYVLLLNPDVEVVSGTFSDLVRALDARPEVGVASGLQLSPAGEVLHSCRRFPSAARQLGEALATSRWPIGRRLQERQLDERWYAREHSVDWVVGAFLAVRREALEDVGLLDERFFLYSEETDWCYRIRAAGWDVRHLPLVSVVHHQGGYARPALVAQLTYSKLLFARKHYPGARASSIRWALALGHLLRLAAAASVGIKRASWRRRARGELRALAVAVAGDRAARRLTPSSPRLRTQEGSA